MASGIWAALLAFGFVAAPQSCEWGLSAYAWAGIGIFVLLAVTPLWATSPRSGRHTLGLAATTFAVWCAGIVVADFQLLCRLW